MINYNKQLKVGLKVVISSLVLMVITILIGMKTEVAGVNWVYLILADILIPTIVWNEIMKRAIRKDMAYEKIEKRIGMDAGLGYLMVSVIFIMAAVSIVDAFRGGEFAFFPWYIVVMLYVINKEIIVTENRLSYQGKIIQIDEIVYKEFKRSNELHIQLKDKQMVKIFHSKVREIEAYLN